MTINCHHEQAKAFKITRKNPDHTTSARNGLKKTQQTHWTSLWAAMIEYKPEHSYVPTYILQYYWHNIEHHRTIQKATDLQLPKQCQRQLKVYKYKCKVIYKAQTKNHNPSEQERVEYFLDVTVNLKNKTDKP